MSAYGQENLLRVLETHEVQPIGAPRATAVEVRVIVATNQALE